ncbi:Rieske 2Fe-2S domain-containing protein [Pseudomonas xanthosomatis]|uniref:Rieske (2Fe-2S) protein n=1 Tax=Pseudomonas xanthosomatis TaxID=2842356 RepID=UPI001C3C4494|nr:Rieske 2Fe-2S domain-containing protein [Pseudomonas xanthosomatis]QXH47674.1 Rieske 2Fe-2S domain-containing protein [Pseudomonas xanthosomatis]
MHYLCPSAALAEGRSRAFKVADLQLFGVRRHGTVYLYRNRCPHRGIGLNWNADSFLDDSGTLIQCAHHGAQFIIDSGECITGPCAGDWLEALDCLEDSQGIWLNDPAAPAAGDR